MPDSPKDVPGLFKALGSKLGPAQQAWKELGDDLSEASEVIGDEEKNPVHSPGPFSHHSGPPYALPGQREVHELVLFGPGVREDGKPVRLEGLGLVLYKGLLFGKREVQRLLGLGVAVGEHGSPYPPVSTTQVEEWRSRPWEPSG